MQAHQEVSHKIPESVLVVIYTPALDVLLIRRSDAQGLWQSVTGSKDFANEPLALTAAREVWEETGIDCRAQSPLAGALTDWQQRHEYDIFPRWRHRYAPGVTRNTEHVFGLALPERVPVQINPQEHSASQWLPWHEAAKACFSHTNAQAILLLPDLPGLPGLQHAHD
jgi:dihydroneopterin triphosphate diphosphatase